MARGPKPIDWKQVEFAMMCSENQEEIAASQGVSRETLRIRFEEEYGVDYLSYSSSLHKKGDVLLREAQMKTALKGNSNMQVWLGKVRLGQQEPDGSNKVAPNQSDVDKDHENLQLKHQLEKERNEKEQLAAKVRAYEESLGIRASE